jgi:hypothetical protein
LPLLMAAHPKLIGPTRGHGRAAIEAGENLESNNAAGQRP